ncbi:SusC/RagA family TonB-linked outer membrane protein [Lutibacter sp. A80]|uniref:SusC/RagA family TonB-linked outer membrane protein n=1 Tax=Lutibacter sp. A80 TaxID=2918453 RepID=UPI001F060D72|nr:SusC/RagA family TonB-linked outer membrane protein [Lutibacter sp. A80]UMB62022.1 SusC/RagA family TonB-linked outer membrane protein [Lutibacter sp. A80]
MRLTIFLCFFSAFSMSPINVLSQNAKIVVDVDKTVSIDEVFNMISNQSDYKFIYHEDLFNNLPLVHLKKGTIKANKLLEQSLSGSNVIFEFTNKNTIVIKESLPVPIASEEDTAPLQQLTITGTVVDDEGQPLPGVNVIVKGSKTGVSTDFNGKYELKLNNRDEKTILIFSYVGFKNQEIVIGTKTIIDVKMTTNLAGLEEVVVIGYGTSKVKDATGVISRVVEAEIEDAPMGVSVEGLLQGKAVGVSVQVQSASPTSPISVIIRGASSLSGDNQPLWVIDGIPQASETTTGNVANTLYNLNLNDVQSIDILKDASATGVYGSRAANGVVIVTTKRGKPNTDPKFEISTRVGYQAMDFNGYNYMDAPQYIEFITAAAKEDILAHGFQYFSSQYIDQDAFKALNTSEYDAFDLQLLSNAFYGANNNWQDIVTQNPLNVDYNFSVRGGSERTNYFVSFNNSNKEGVVIGGESKIYGGRLNFETSINDNIKFGLNLTGSTRKTVDKDGMLFTLKGVRPDLPGYNEDGTIFTRDYYTENPYTALLNSNDGKGINFSGTAFVELKIIENLKLRTSFANSYTDSERLQYTRKGSYTETLGERSWSDSKSSRDLFENTLTYAALINKKHDIKALAGYSIENNVSGSYYMSGQNFPDDDILNNFGSQAAINYIGESETKSALVSQFVRLHYKFDDRYIISGTLRRDGSSRFGADKRWGTFPSVAAAWLITGENFMKSDKIKKQISYLKLRTSIGKTGSQNLGNFDWITEVDAATYNETPAILPASLGNPDLQWEETEMFDFGLDFGLLDDRIYGAIGIYQKKSNKLIYDEDIPWSSSFRDITSNVASMHNKGFEFNIKYDILRKSDQRLTFDFNYSNGKTKVTKINGNQTELIFPGSYAPYIIVEEGDVIGEWFGLQTAGRFFVNAEDAYGMRNSLTDSGVQEVYRSSNESGGDLIFVDQNGDGEITDDDRVHLGTSVPKGFGGFGLTYQYKNFRINTTFTYAYGHKRLWDQLLGDAEYLGDFNQSNNIAGQSATVLSPYDALYPRMTLDGVSNGEFSDFYLHDASYVRLNALNISYKLPSKFFNNSIVNGVDLTFQGTNLFTITKYPGFDPQGGGSGYTDVDAGAAIDGSIYPSAKVFSLGIKLNLQ